MATFNPKSDTAVVAADYSRVLSPGDGEGWLARRDLIPLGYLGDDEKTARTFPTIDGVRWSVPGDRARFLDDGRIELLGPRLGHHQLRRREDLRRRGGAAMAEHPDVYDVVVAGRPSERWGNEVVAIVQIREGRDPSDEELLDTCRRQSRATSCRRPSSGQPKCSVRRRVRRTTAGPSRSPPKACPPQQNPIAKPP